MLTYPGGHIRHAHINGYAFFLDSLSDLGETRTPTGRPKVASLVFFCSALLLVACTLPAFSSHTLRCSHGTRPLVGSRLPELAPPSLLGFLSRGWLDRRQISTNPCTMSLNSLRSGRFSQRFCAAFSQPCVRAASLEASDSSLAPSRFCWRRISVFRRSDTSSSIRRCARGSYSAQPHKRSSCTRRF